MDEMNNNITETTENTTNTKPAAEYIPGKGQATASLVLGIIAIALLWFGYSALISMVLGVVGLILASKSKKAGFTGGTRTAGFILSLIGLILGAVMFVACVACAGLFVAGAKDAAMDGTLEDALNEAMQSLE